ncbi:hypothetical protein [Persicobacter sp. CCB-QB2]|uniref:hypothetical protein n=1 Tax=Persicobacter sp. CCB-QB2 TaxID=1561025 RepID=UPI0006A9B1AA|nr:hypothetical protein [Persicobacter sp. CCB-QB2]
MSDFFHIHFHCWEKAPQGFQPIPDLQTFDANIAAESNLLSWDNFSSLPLSSLLSDNTPHCVYFSGTGKSGKSLMDFINYLRQHPPEEIRLLEANQFLENIIKKIPKRED